MGHHISAVILKGPFDPDLAASFDMRPILLVNGLTLFPLDARYLDYWAEKLGVTVDLTDVPMFSDKLIHRMLQVIASDPLFAIIETDYVGGNGSQAAVVYHGELELMSARRTCIGPLKSTLGPINSALRHLGVVAYGSRDEFDTLGLGQYRDFWEVFNEYGDCEK